MPPQSRGSSPSPVSPPNQRHFSKSGTLPPNLRPYLDNLPAPTAFVPGDQRTPTGPRIVVPDRDIATPTPSPEQRRGRSATSFHLGDDDRDGNDEDEENQRDGMREERLVPEGQGHPDDVEGVTLTDDDFESHYSRQDTSASEEEEDDEEVSEDELEGHDHSENQQRQNGTKTSPDGAGYFPSHADQPGSLSRVRSLPVRPPIPHSHSHSGGSGGGLHVSQSFTSLQNGQAPPPPLYPPFYNRPPTPLPPSPSLTSLLRPPSLLNRSATSTRPTTPDSSDVETPNDTEAAVAHSARRAHPLPPTSPKVPTYEYYGFVLYLTSSLAFLIYILWSYLPSPFLHALGITYYPNRWWSLAIPAWIVMLLVYIYVALLAYNVEYLTLPLASLECMVDDAGNVAIVDEYGRVRKGGSKAFVNELEQRAKYAKEMEAKAKSKGKGKGRKSSRSNGTTTPGGGNAGGGSKSSRRRKSSRSEPDPFLPSPSSRPPEIPERYISPTPLSSYSQSHTHHMYAQSNGTNGRANSTSSQNPNLMTDSGYPNWKLVWNEGTDAVMDIPIGGVCEVLYGDADAVI